MAATLLAQELNPNASYVEASSPTSQHTTAAAVAMPPFYKAKTGLVNHQDFLDDLIRIALHNPNRWLGLQPMITKGDLDEIVARSVN